MKDKIYRITLPKLDGQVCFSTDELIRSTTLLMMAYLITKEEGTRILDKLNIGGYIIQEEVKDDTVNN